MMKTQSPGPSVGEQAALFDTVQQLLAAYKDQRRRRQALERWLAEGLSPRQTAVPEPADQDFARLLRQREEARLGAREQTHEHLLHQLSRLFVWDVPASQVESRLRRELIALEEAEEQVIRGAEVTLAATLRFELRAAITRQTDSESTLAEKLVELIGFFERRPVEIGGWTRFFLDIEGYHREKKVRDRERREILGHIRRRLDLGGCLNSAEEFVIYLDAALDEAGESASPEELGRQLTEKLQGHLAPDLFPHLELSLLVPITLSCHCHCRQETITDRQALRLAELKASRQIYTLEDLMLLVYDQILGARPLPTAAAVLDRLQEQGFPIEHRDFKDTYRAQLVPAELGRMAAAKSFYVPTPLETLSGDLGPDLESQRSSLIDHLDRCRRRLARQAFMFYQALQRPLPRAELLKATAGFALSWELAAQLSRDGGDSLGCARAEDLVRSAQALLPKGMLKLIRPRKGYEFKSRDEFRFYLNRAAQAELEILQEILGSGRVTSPHHCGILLRLLLLAPLALQKPPAEFSQSDCLAAIEAQSPEKVLAARARRLGIDLAEAASASPACLTGMLSRALPQEEICNRALHRLSTRRDQELAEEAAREFRAQISRLAPEIYRLAVARARKEAGLERLPARIGSLGQLAELLAPALPNLDSIAQQQTEARIRAEGTQGLLGRYRPFVESRQELTALAKYHLREILQGESLELYSGQHDMSELEAQLSESLARYQLAPGILEGRSLSSFLLQILQPEDEADGRKRAQAVIELLQLLPRSDCAACGQGSCQLFAAALLRRRVQPSDCRQLEEARLPQLQARLEELLASGLPGPPEELTEQESHLLQRLTRVEEVVARLKMLEQQKKNFQERGAQLRIFKRPDPEAFYGYLKRYLGLEAVERLRPEERRFLEEHGETRVRACWQALRAESDWMQQELRRRQSSGFQQQLDPREISRQFYADKLFLSQLSQADRHLVLQHRMLTHMEDFAQWWNEDLLEMSEPGYQIQDWDDFTKIIKNAYWHQESTPAAAEVLTAFQARLQQEPALRQSSQRFLSHYLHRLAGQEYQGRKKKRQQLEKVLAAGRIETRQQLALVLTHFVTALPRSLRHGPIKLAPRAVAEAFARFNEAGLEIAADLRFAWDELDEQLQANLSGDAGVAAAELASFRQQPAGLRWGEMDTLRSGLSRALLTSIWEEQRRESLEARLVTDIFTAKTNRAPAANHCGPPGPPRLLPGMLRCYLRQRFKSPAVNLDSIRAELERRLQRQPQLWAQLLEEALSQHIRQRLSLAMETGNGRPSLEGDPETVELTGWLDAEIQRRISIDRQRLLRYLYLLAKMEGNLDSLTALLRGIRETADIIEAAWLQFTVERAGLPPLPETQGKAIPLRAAVVKDKDRLNHCLRHGLPRGEKPEVTQAIRDLLTHIRYHILQAKEEEVDPETILSRMQARGYLLDGIDRQALLAAVEAEISRATEFRKNRIWIYTMVTAHNLAAANPALLEAERALYKNRSRILLTSEDGPEGESLEAVCSRRGVELARVKEEMYYQLSELLEEERIDSFQRRIEQIVVQLDRKRAEIGQGWRQGLINRRTVFYVLRRFQKEAKTPSWADYLAFVREHWSQPLQRLAMSGRPEVEELQQRLARRMQSVLGLDLPGLEQNAREAARQELEAALNERLQTIKEVFQSKEPAS